MTTHTPKSTVNIFQKLFLYSDMQSLIQDIVVDICIFPPRWGKFFISHLLKEVFADIRIHFIDS